MMIPVATIPLNTQQGNMKKRNLETRHHLPFLAALSDLHLPGKKTCAHVYPSKSSTIPALNPSYPSPSLSPTLPPADRPKASWRCGWATSPFTTSPLGSLRISPCRALAFRVEQPPRGTFTPLDLTEKEGAMSVLWPKFGNAESLPNMLWWFAAIPLRISRDLL